MLVQHGEKGGGRGSQNPRKATGRSQAASGAVGEVHVGFGVADYLAQADQFRRASEREPAASSSLRDDEAAEAEMMDDLHQMIARKSVGVGDFGDCRAAGGRDCQMDEDAQGVVGVASQLHEGMR